MITTTNHIYPIQEKPYCQFKHSFKCVIKKTQQVQVMVCV